MAITLQDAIALGYPTTPIPSDGQPGGTCLWHRQHEWWEAHRALPTPCSICGGDILDGGTRHELCRALEARGLPTPRIDHSRPCPCAPCSAAREEAGS